MDNSRYPYIDVCNTINEMKIEYKKITIYLSIRNK